MLPNILTLVAIFSICAFGVAATSIEKDPNKRKGAGAPFQMRRGKLWGYVDRTGKVIIQPQFDAEGDFFHSIERHGIFLKGWRRSEKMTNGIT